MCFGSAKPYLSLDAAGQDFSGAAAQEQRQRWTASPAPTTVQTMTTAKQRILVTGGAGFIGMHLCARLLDDGHEVVCADNFYTGRHFNIERLLKRKGFTLLNHDITEPLDVTVDAIVNLASPASPVHYQINPVQTTKTSVLGAINMLDLATKLGAVVLQASTSEVYGDPEVHPQTEDYWGNVNPIGPRACYDEGKRCAETLFFDYRRQHGTAIKIVRIFNTYGPGMQPHDGRVVPNFVMQALRGEPVLMHGNGLQSRSFCYVEDLVDGLVRMLHTSTDVTGPVNLGNPAEISMLDLAKQIIALTGSTSTITHTTAQPDDPRRRCPNISLAKSLLDWVPRTPLDEGLRRTVDYFRPLAA